METFILLIDQFHTTHFPLFQVQSGGIRMIDKKTKEDSPWDITLMDTARQQSGLGRWQGLEEKLREEFGENAWSNYTAHVNH